MKKTASLFAILGLGLCGLFAQDRYPVTQLTSDPAQQGFPTWSPDGEFIIYQHSERNDSLGQNGLWRVRPDGTEATRICHELAEHPRWSPDGKLVVFDADTGNNIKLVAATGGKARAFLPDSVHIERGGLPCWSPDGSYIAFLEAGNLSVCTYKMEDGTLQSIFRQEGMLPMIGGWMPDGWGVLIALMDRESRRSTLWKVRLDGKEKEQIQGHHANLYRYAAPSPDGTWLVYGVYDQGYSQLYIMPADGGPSLPLTLTAQGHHGGPSWSPDGKRLAFTSTRSGAFDVWIMDLDLEDLRRELLPEDR